VASGNVLLLTITETGSSVPTDVWTPTDSAIVELIHNQPTVAGGNNGQGASVWGKRLQGSELSGSFTLVGGPNEAWRLHPIIAQNCKLKGSFYGHTDKANGGPGTTQTGSVPAITASAPNSLAVIILCGAQTGISGWPPSGWTDSGLGDANFYIAYKTLVNQGDSSGSPTWTLTGANSWTASIIELLGADGTPGDFWSNGEPSYLIAGPPAPAPIVIARGTPF
jgi:hypothetical protein